MINKLLFILMFIPALANCQTMLIKSVLENPRGKMIVVDTTITDFESAKKSITLFFNNSNVNIVTLQEYGQKKKELAELQTIFWGLFVKDGLIWNSLAGDRAETIKKQFAAIPNEMSVIIFGKNPFTEGKALLFTSKSINGMAFNRDIVDDNKSLNAFYNGKLVETGLMDANFKTYELNSSAFNDIPDKSLRPDETIKDGNITVFNYKLADMTIVTVPDTLNFIFVPNEVKPFEEMAKENNFRYMINSTYFAGNNLKAKHCGILKNYEQIISPDLMQDKQIKYVVSYNRKDRKIDYSYFENFKPSSDANTLEFQTGPLVIENNKLSDTAIRSSINWERKTKRTLIASLDNKDIFLIIVRENVDMINLGKFLLKLSIFKDRKLDVMNLDGGSSTALYSKNHPKLGYRLSARLPLLIGIK